MTTSKRAPESPVEWRHLHARIATAQAHAERLLAPSEADEAAVLRDRARKLARPVVLETTSAGDDLIAFTLPGERYAVPTTAVRHVFPSAPPVAIPWAPPLFRGLVNHRGRPLLVVDVGLLLGRPTRADDAAVSLVLVLGDGSDNLGLAVSTAEHLGRLADETLTRDRLPEGLADVGFVRGVTASRLLVLDVDKLLHDPRLVLGPAG